MRFHQINHVRVDKAVIVLHVVQAYEVYRIFLGSSTYLDVP